MKPAPFTYHAPSSKEEVVDLLGEFGDEGRILAGGQTLLPLMNYRQTSPKNLIDINPVSELEYIRADNGSLTIGACARQSALERSPEAAERVPLLVEAVGFVAYPSVRNRGTVAGSIAYADPASELPATVLAMDGEILVAGRKGERKIPAADFFRGPYTNACSPDELVIGIHLERWPIETGHAFLEFQRKHGSYALMGAAILVHLDGEKIDRAAIALCGVAETPVRATKAEEVLLGNVPGIELFEEAAEAARSDLEPLPDTKGSAEYRRKLAKVYVRRGLELAVERAKGGE